jgi:putative FmdB family regulatory protein
MPTYSYRCTECGEAFDIQQAFTDDTLTACPNCGGKLRKIFNAVGVSFTGSGFYRNDSRAPAPKEGGSGSSESTGSTTPASAPAKSDSSKSETSKSTPSTSSPTPAAPATTSKKE